MAVRTTAYGGGYAGLQIEFTGLDVAEAYLKNLAQGVEVIATLRAQIGSDLPYAWGIEFGWRRSGRLARRAGPAYYMQAGMEAGWLEVQGLIHAMDNIDMHPAMVVQACQGILNRILQVAQEVVPVVSGQLRGSLVVTQGPHPGANLGF